MSAELHNACWQLYRLVDHELACETDPDRKANLDVAVGHLKKAEFALRAPLKLAPPAVTPPEAVADGGSESGTDAASGQQAEPADDTQAHAPSTLSPSGATTTSADSVPDPTREREATLEPA